ncbi:MAG: hypothetical protein AVDCRST_MAG73-3537, partial [uncultured Thermomicrobiales bacterium]
GRPAESGAGRRRGGGSRAGVDARVGRRRVPGSHLYLVLRGGSEAGDRGQRGGGRYQLGRRILRPPAEPVHQPAPGDAAPGHHGVRGGRRRPDRGLGRPAGDQRGVRDRPRLRRRLDGRAAAGERGGRGGAGPPPVGRRLRRPGDPPNRPLRPTPGAAGAGDQRPGRHPLGDVGDRRRRNPGAGDEPADGDPGQSGGRHLVVHGRDHRGRDRVRLLRRRQDRRDGGRAGDGRRLPRRPVRLPPHPPRPNPEPGRGLRPDPALPGRLPAAKGGRDHAAGTAL